MAKSIEALGRTGRTALLHVETELEPVPAGAVGSSDQSPLCRRPGNASKRRRTQSNLQTSESAKDADDSFAPDLASSVKVISTRDPLNRENSADVIQVDDETPLADILNCRRVLAESGSSSLQRPVKVSRIFKFIVTTKSKLKWWSTRKFFESLPVSRVVPESGSSSLQRPVKVIIDVTSKSKSKRWSKFSPFYPHGGIKVPFLDETSESVEGVWQGLKVWNVKANGVPAGSFDESKFHIKTMDKARI